MYMCWIRHSCMVTSRGELNQLNYRTSKHTKCLKILSKYLHKRFGRAKRSENVSEMSMASKTMSHGTVKEDRTWRIRRICICAHLHFGQLRSTCLSVVTRRRGSKYGWHGADNLDLLYGNVLLAYICVCVCVCVCVGEGWGLNCRHSQSHPVLEFL